MDDNKGVSCPIRGFSPAEFQPSPNIFSSENQNNSSDKEDKKDNWLGGGKEGSSFAVPNLSLMLPKKLDDSQDSQEELLNPDLHNGHNNPHPIDIKHRNKSIGELLEESKDLPDTVLMDCSKDYSSARTSDTANSEKDKNEDDKVKAQMLEENSRDSKGQDDISSQDLFGENDTNGNSKEASDFLPSSQKQDTQSSEGFDLHLSETQSFLPSSEKEKERVRESEDSRPTEEDSNGKLDVLNDDKSSDNIDSKNESDTVENVDESDSKDSSKEKESTEQDLNTEDISSGSDGPGKDGVEEAKAAANETPNNKEKGDDEVMDVSDSEEKTSEQTSSEKKESEEEKSSDLVDDSKNDSSEKVANESHKDEDEAMEVEETKEDKEGNEEGDKKDEGGDESKDDDKAEGKVDGDGETEEIEQPKAAPPKTPARSQRKRQAKKEEPPAEAATVTEPQSSEAEETTKSSDSVPEDATSCSCQPACHRRIETVSEYLNSACSQLENFIKLKRREENKNLKNFLDMLKEITSVSQNKQVVGETKIGEHILIPEETPPKRKSGIKRKSSDAETPLKETPRKRINTEEKSTKKVEKKSNVDFKDLKGLAVFAKWPNSGWYYPGKVEELSGSDWKEANNVTVKFYDGLVREMKNINILPAYLIPPGSMLSDLDDETEMVVLSCDGSNQNNVDFKLGTKDNSGREIEMNFNKLAIKANHMKTIKQQLEPTTDVLPKKMHMVSLDNLVSGRRSRGRSKKDADSADEKTPTNQTERRSASSASSTPSRKSATPKRTRN